MLSKQAIDISFAQGLDTKTDPKRVPVGNFVALNNSVFTRGGLLQKRNGYQNISSNEVSGSLAITTLRNNLTSIGSDISVFDSNNELWIQRSQITPLSVETSPLIRNNFNQSQVDSAVAPNGLVGVVYTENTGGGIHYNMAVLTGDTSQVVLAPANIGFFDSGFVVGSPRIFALGEVFVVVHTTNRSGVYYLAYQIINSVTLTTSLNSTLLTAYDPGATPDTTVAWDGLVLDNKLYLSFNSVSSSIGLMSLDVYGAVTGPVFVAGESAEVMTIAADTFNPSKPIIYVSYWETGGNGRVFASYENLSLVFAPVTFDITSPTYANLVSMAYNGYVYIISENVFYYGYSGSIPGIPDNFLKTAIVSQTGAITQAAVITQLGVGLASKAFFLDNVIYYLVAYQSPYQPTYFLMSQITQGFNVPYPLLEPPTPIAKIAYQNGGGYLLAGLPSVSLIGSKATIAFLYKDLIAAVNKDTNPTGQTAGVYSQLGINLATFDFSPAIDSVELGSNLNISGGFLWSFDGLIATEQNFFLYPDSVKATFTNGSGDIDPADGPFWYQVTYEWTDNQGNAFRSAPSIPVEVIPTAGANGHVTIDVPNLRLTYKDNVKIVVYRWSAHQQVYYQTTSIQTPTLSSLVIPYRVINDTNSNAAILGNNILYTTGGVVENIGPPATGLMTIFDNRLWLVDSEDQNLLWYSKQVIEATPVEMSDLFTVYVSPTISAIGQTGPISALSVLDDKLIIFKRNAIYYMNGNGPDNTGANSSFSQPIFITATVGCTNQRSICFMPDGLLFQSDKGIWLLKRDLSTEYIGAPVEKFNGSIINSATNIPETNQVRLSLSSGETLMYDYFYAKWGTFTGVPAISGCIYNGLHTLLNSSGIAYQELPGSYIDGGEPVLMSFTTGPIQLGGFQSYQRAYFFYLLGSYISPHILNVSVSYDYGAESSSVVIRPTNYSTPYGAGSSQSPYGSGSPYGGPGSLEDWRVFLSRQRCQALAISVAEYYDPSLGVAPGAGFTLSGLSILCAFKSPFRPQPNVNSVGAS